MCGPRAVLFLLLTGLTMCTVSNEKQSSDDELKKLYQSGVDAYLENNFSRCVGRLEASLEKYREYRQKIVACRQMCAMDAELFEPFSPVDVENLRFYEKTLRGTLCLINCRNGDELLSRTATISPDTEKIFEHRKPYQYLHLCYFQTNNSQKAASSAYTYLAAFPTDEDMKKSLKHYTTLPEVKSDTIENYEIQNFVYLYSYGANAYDQKDWETTVNNMEESLIQVIQAEDECRFLCEGPFNQEWMLDFIPSIANHFTHVLRCKMGCMEKLSRINGDVYEDLLPSHYDYLQFAYYKMGKLREACRAAASHLLFYPNDVKMKNNMEYYIKLPKVDESYFSPRPEAVHYMNRNRYERHIIKFVDKEFQLDNLIRATQSEKDSKVVLVPLEKNDEGEGSRKKEMYKTIQLILDEVDLNGTQRFMADGLAGGESCRVLVKLAKNFAIEGDGYETPTPHTSMEKLSGLTLGQAAVLLYYDRLNPAELEPFFEISNLARDLLVNQFKLKRKLYFTYSHLVCRSAISHSFQNRTDFSHSVHADNCNLINEQLCPKLPPSYYWRDYSAIVYLNGDFTGGEFIFASDMNGTRVQSAVKPKCGRMVGFSSGPENLHGVKAVVKGTRCALAMWFTFDGRREESERSYAYELYRAKKLSS